MKSKLHLNYSVSSSFAFTAKEKTIDCKEDPRKKSKYLKKKGEMIKKRNGSLENIGDKITLLNPMNTFCLLPSPGVVISAYTFGEELSPHPGRRGVGGEGLQVPDTSLNKHRGGY